MTKIKDLKIMAGLLTKHCKLNKCLNKKKQPTGSTKKRKDWNTFYVAARGLVGEDIYSLEKRNSFAMHPSSKL